MITKDLGIVTAYGYAVSKGYTGTEEEFAELMASYATVAEQAAQSASTASEKAQQAAQAVLDAVQAKDGAVQAKTDAETARDSAAGSASSASQSAQSASGSASSASQSASAASSSAESAAGSANSASQSATDAETAKTDAQTAKADAETAKDEAETAQAKAEEAQAKAEEAADDLSAEVEQIETNKNDIANLKSDLSKYDFTPTLTSADVVTGYYIRGDTGIPVASGDYVCTDFVPIPDESVGLELACQCFFGSIVGCAFYSAKSVNAYLDGETGTGWTQKTVNTTIPNGAKFFRTTLQASAYTSPADFGIHYQRYIATIREDVDKIQNDVTTLAELTAYTNNNTKAIRKYPNWVNGTIDSAGNIYSRTDRLATGIMVADVASIKCVNDYYGLIAYYDEDKHFIEMTSFVKNFSIDHRSFPTGTYYIAVAIHNGTGSITTSEGENCILLYSVDDVVKGTFDQTADSVPFIEGSKNQIARLGWDVYNALNPPQQTAQSYALAYKNGCRIMLCDVRITQDGEYVLWHDETLNNSVRHTDGTTLSDTEKAMTIAGSTLSELNAFDYGIYRGAEYADMKIPMLDDFLKWCTLANCIPMLEIKVQLTETDCVAIAKMCKQYGLGDRVIIGEYYDNLQTTVNYWKANLPKCKLCIFAWGDVWRARDFINANLSNTDIDILLTISSTSQLYLISSNNQIDYSKVQTVTNLGAKLTFTEVDSSSVMSELYEGGYIDVISYISSSYINVNAWLANALGLT